MSRQQIQKPTTALNYDENNSGSTVVKRCRHLDDKTKDGLCRCT